MSDRYDEILKELEESERLGAAILEATQFCIDEVAGNGPGVKLAQYVLAALADRDKFSPDRIARWRSAFARQAEELHSAMSSLGDLLKIIGDLGEPSREADEYMVRLAGDKYDEYFRARQQKGS